MVNLQQVSERETSTAQLRSSKSFCRSELRSMPLSALESGITEMHFKSHWPTAKIFSKEMFLFS